MPTGRRRHRPALCGFHFARGHRNGVREPDRGKSVRTTPRIVKISDSCTTEHDARVITEKPAAGRDRRPHRPPGPRSPPIAMGSRAAATATAGAGEGWRLHRKRNPRAEAPRRRRPPRFSQRSTCTPRQKARRSLILAAAGLGSG
jgi:hypothetical protein